MHIVTYESINELSPVSAKPAIRSISAVIYHSQENAEALTFHQWWALTRHLWEAEAAAAGGGAMRHVLALLSSQ